MTAPTQGSHLDRKVLDHWATYGTLHPDVVDTHGAAREVLDAIPDSEMPDDLHRALLFLT